MNDMRPLGCHFDAYGAEEEFLSSLNCRNCPLIPLLCEYKGEATIARLANATYGEE